MEWRKQHEPIVITALGAYVMNKHDEWRTKVAQTQGFLPLHKMEREYRDATLRFFKENVKIYGKEVPSTRIERVDPPEGIREPTREEWDAYNKAQDIWIAEKILRDWKWVDFVKYCGQHNLEYLVEQHQPCEDSTGQCQFVCPRINQNCERWYEGL